MPPEQDEKYLAELSSEDPYIRYAAVQRIDDLAHYLGPEQTLTKLIPKLQCFSYTF